MKDSKIFIFTNSYPYGNGYNWLDSEIALLNKHFMDVTVSPYSYEGNKIAKDIPSYKNVSILKPVVDQDVAFHSVWQVRKILNPRAGFYLREFFQERVYTKPYWFKSWIQAVIKTENLLKSDIFKRLKETKNKNATALYFYWGNNQALIVPFLKRMGFNQILVRFHGFDLYKERLGGYQPFRRPLLGAVSLAAPISDYGSSYLKSEYPDIAFSTRTMRLGVRDIGRASASDDGWFRIVSCATIIKLKRIDLIVRVLKRLQLNIEWTHLGDGDCKNKVDKEIEELPDHLKVNMSGRLPADEIQHFYKNHKVDLFISLSETEGIPVSIMEALAAGIPVFSTDVGGIKEIVDEEVGHLIDAGSSEDSLVTELATFIDKYRNNQDRYRNAAYQQFLKLCKKEYWDQKLLNEIRVNYHNND
jgi:glycosyltransferase involved in cell wall biosynthesis